MNKALEEYVQKIPSLPTLPAIAQEILMIIDDDTISIDRLVNITEKDPAISVRILTVSNSAYWGGTTHTENLHDAIMRIGFRNVKYLTMGICLLTLFEDKDRDRSNHYNKIFKHSMAVGLTAKHLTRSLNLPESDEVLMCGILHDIGLLVTVRYFFDSYQKVLALMEKGSGLIEAEESVMGFTHPELGNWMTEEWGLPDDILDVNLYHHLPSAAKRNKQQIALVHTADHMVSRGKLRSTLHDPQYSFDTSCLNILKTTAERLNQIEIEIGEKDIFSDLLI